MKRRWEEELEKSLLEKFWYEMKLRCVVSGIFLLIAIAFLCFLGIEAAGVVFFLIAIVFFCVFCLPLLLDAPAAKGHRFEMAVGKILRYEETGIGYARTRFYPVVKDEQTGEELQFAVHLDPSDAANRFAPPRTGIDERYLFLYLKNSKVVVWRKAPGSYGEEE